MFSLTFLASLNYSFKLWNINLQIQSFLMSGFNAHSMINGIVYYFIIKNILKIAIEIKSFSVLQLGWSGGRVFSPITILYCTIRLEINVSNSLLWWIIHTYALSRAKLTNVPGAHKMAEGQTAVRTNVLYVLDHCQLYYWGNKSKICVNKFKVGKAFYYKLMLSTNFNNCKLSINS